MPRLVEFMRRIFGFGFFIGVAVTAIALAGGAAAMWVLLAVRLLLLLLLLHSQPLSLALLAVRKILKAGLLVVVVERWVIYIRIFFVI